MMWLAVVLLCASFGTSASLHLHLTSYPQSAVDGVEFTLSCTTTQSGGLIGVRWYRNNVDMFTTSSDAHESTSIFNTATTSNESRAVAGRVTVSSSLQQHNVTLRINSTLDQGSVWKCQSGSRFSNDVTVEITDNTEAPATIRLTSYPQSAVDGAEFTLSCTTTQSGGFISISWYRNNVYIFKTSSDADVSTSILKPNTTLSEYRAVAGRVTVSSSLQQLNVTLRINSTLDQGSVWKCQSGNRFSNNVAVEITYKSEGSISVKATRHPVKDGQILTLICESTNVIKETVWSRNSVNIFKSILQTSMLVYDTTSPQYQSVAGRVTVNSTLKQHNVSLRINFTLDQGSVWRCHTGDLFSNNVTLDVVEYIRGDAVTTITTSEDGSILPLTVTVASIIVVIVIVVASFISVLQVRKYKKDIAESNSQMYSTMSRDPDTDNNYSELDPGLTSKRLPASQPVTTEESVAYYNTVPADSQYENPPASTEKPDSSYE